MTTLAAEIAKLSALASHGAATPASHDSYSPPAELIPTSKANTLIHLDTYRIEFAGFCNFDQASLMAY
jgi:hypothetical protein